MGRNNSKNSSSNIDTTMWMVTFGDLLMLLLTFFVMLLSMSSMDVKSLKTMFSIFSGASGALELSESNMIKAPRDIGRSPSKGMGMNHLKTLKLLEDLASKIGVPEGRIGALITSRKMFEECFSLADDVGEDQVLIGVESIMQISEDDRGVVISFQANVLFDPGQAEIRPAMFPLLDMISKVLGDVSNDVLIMGHTDNVPIRTKRYRSNWELSLYRALNVHKYFVESKGLSPERFGVGGYGDSRPQLPNNTRENREKNRRVEIILKRT